MSSPGAIAVKVAIEQVKALSVRELEKRRKVATGRTMRSLTISLTSSDAAQTGKLEGDEQWKWVGNGRGPGRMPPLGPIQEWVNARRLTISAYAVARTIAKQGSKDFREGNQNVFLSAFEQFEKGPGLAKLENDGAGEFEQQAIDLAVKNLKDGRSR